MIIVFRFIALGAQRVTNTPTFRSGMLLAAGTISRGEVIENKMQDMGRTIATGHFGRTIETVELELDIVGRISIERPHPLYEFSIRVQSAKIVAESGILQGLIRCRTETGHVVVFTRRARGKLLSRQMAL